MLYKNMVCARKDPATDNIFIESYVFELKKIGVNFNFVFNFVKKKKNSLFDTHP